MRFWILGETCTSKECFTFSAPSGFRSRFAPYTSRSDHLDDRELARLAAYLGFDVDPKDLDHDADGLIPSQLSNLSCGFRGCCVSSHSLAEPGPGSISLNEFQDFVGRMGGAPRLQSAHIQRFKILCGILFFFSLSLSLAASWPRTRSGRVLCATWCAAVCCMVSRCVMRCATCSLRCSGSSSSVGSRCRTSLKSPVPHVPHAHLRSRAPAAMPPVLPVWQSERACGVTTMLPRCGTAVVPLLLCHMLSCTTEAGTKPDRKKSEQAEEAIVIGVHFKGEEDIAAPSQLEVQLEFLRQDERCLRFHVLDRTFGVFFSHLFSRGGRKTCVPAHWIVSTEEDAEVAAALREAAQT